jgi:hypothetical protein
MTDAISSASSAARPPGAWELGQSPHGERVRPRRERRAGHASSPLGRYTDSDGQRRELITRQGSGGSVLVLDRDVATRGDRRLLAHLAVDEPAENAAIVCRHYLEDSPEKRRGFRALTSEDTWTVPFAGDPQAEAHLAATLPAVSVDRHGCSYELGQVQTGMSIPELRWRRHRPAWVAGEVETISLREAIGCLESYEPVRTLTVRALSLHDGEPGVSTSVLCSELERVRRSPIVLNRRLREVTLATVERQELSMSEIAIRCGRLKHDRKGNVSGETSWLARRLGLLAEGGQSAPTPWVHSDVLALIARAGLGIPPREVELG